MKAEARRRRAWQPAGEPQTTGKPVAEETTAEDDEAAIRSLADRYASAWRKGIAAADKGPIMEKRK